MIPCMCLVQAGQISAETRAALAQKLDGFTRSNFGSAAEIRWIEVAAGSGFTAGQPSTTSVVSMTAPAPLDQSTRAALLQELCGFWAADTDGSLDEVMAVIADPLPH